MAGWKGVVIYMTSLVGATSFEVVAIWSVLVVAFLGLAYALFLRIQIMRQDKGTEKMQEVWRAISAGADAYLKRQLKIIVPLIFVLTVVLFLSVYVVPPSGEALQRFAGWSPDRVSLIVGLARAAAFVMGALFSLMVGQFGMRMAVQGNIRVAAAARSSFSNALKIAYRSGTITGMLTDGLGLLGGTSIFIIFGIASPDVLLGFGFGGTLLALFMRVGGGIYTKAADVGADLVGKLEENIPEDDPRNAAVIADLVGDNVGDCAGMAADIFESYEVTIVSALILGLALVAITHQLKWIIFPLLVRGIGVISSIIGTYLVKGKEGDKSGDAFASINRGFYSSAAISLVAFFFLAMFYMHEWRAFLSVGVGIFLAIAIDEITKYFTHTHYAPVKEIAHASKTGAATLILRGLSIGFESSAWQFLVIAITIWAAIMIYWGQRLHVGRMHRHHRVEKERQIDALGLGGQFECVAIAIKGPRAFSRSQINRAFIHPIEKTVFQCAFRRLVDELYNSIAYGHNRSHRHNGGRLNAYQTDTDGYLFKLHG